MEKISFCIPSKSNLRYLKTCIPSIRENASRGDHDIIVFVDSDEDGTIKWLEEKASAFNVRYFINPHLGTELYGIGRAYDYCIEKAETDIVMIFHADMMLGPSADLNAYKHLSEGKVVCATRVEPPLHPNAGEKILRDYGMWPEEFKADAFTTFAKELIQSNRGKTTEGIFAPWMVYKKDILEIGGHDPMLKSCREDSDLFNRFKLNGYKLIQSWDSIVYHLTGRGAGSFDGDQARHLAWKKEMENSTREFIRKWGTGVLHTPMMNPIIAPKYDIGIVLDDITLLEVLEPWCNTIYVKGDYSEYITKEQPNTLYDLRERIKPFDNEKNNEILIEVVKSTFTQQDFQIIQQLPQIIQQQGELGRFQLGNVVMEIIQMNEYQNKLINI